MCFVQYLIVSEGREILVPITVLTLESSLFLLLLFFFFFWNLKKKFIEDLKNNSYKIDFSIKLQLHDALRLSC